LAFLYYKNESSFFQIGRKVEQHFVMIFQLFLCRFFENIIPDFPYVFSTEPIVPSSIKTNMINDDWFTTYNKKTWESM
jgi:hypothetical protein